MEVLSTSVFLILVAVFNPAKAEDEDEGPLVQIEQGALRGLKTESVREKEFLAFLGVPYAKPPVGELRFKAPLPPEPWNGTYEALEEGNNCPQIGLLSEKVEGDENCLFLNIFTNKLPENTNDLKAVMVWIHGGAFVTGSGTSIMFGPDHLLFEDVVLVTINYRLGLLGFLSLQEAGIPGNNGIKDQVMALRWVQKNIANFGGDPNRVTIFGQSAGGASVHLHLMSPMSAGLFHGAISQSGTGLAHWSYAEPDYLREAAFEIGVKIGCKTTDAKELLQCFLKKPANDFVNVTGHEDETGVSFAEFTPTREDGSIYGEGVFLPGKPDDLVSMRKFYVVPFITGINSKEALTFMQLTKAPSFWDKFDKNFDKLIANISGKERSRIKEASENVKKRYFGDKKPSEDTLDNFIDFFTDSNFVVAADRVVKKHAAFSTAPIYYYYFEFDGQLGVAKQAVKITKPGVAHADELGYMFNTAISPPIEEGSDENITLTTVVKLWTNFAKTGNPTDATLNITWEPYTRSDPVYLNINTNFSMQRDLLQERMLIWSEVMNP